MMNQADNELLTRIDPGTAMGAMLREYRVPACRSARLEADGAPSASACSARTWSPFVPPTVASGSCRKPAGIRAVSFAFPREADWREVDPYELEDAAA